MFLALKLQAPAPCVLLTEKGMERRFGYALGFQDSCLYLCVSWNSNFCVVTSPHPENFCMKRLPKNFVSVSLFQVLRGNAVQCSRQVHRKALG